jgi:PAS domain S-box-containing protein
MKNKATHYRQQKKDLHPVKESDDSLVWFNVSGDNTNQKLSPGELSESEQWFSVIFHANPGPQVITVEDSGFILDVNQAYCDLVEYTREELLGHTSPEMGIWNVNERQTAMELLRLNGSVKNLEITVQTRSGKIRNLIISMERFILGGKECLISTGLDITQRKDYEKSLYESEQRFMIIFRSNAVAIGITRWPDLKIVEVNDAWCRLTGYSREQVIGKTSTEIGLATPETLSEFRLMLNNNQVIRDFEVQLNTCDHQQRQVLVSIETIELGGEPCMLTSLLDITDRIQFEKELKKREQELQTIFDLLPVGVSIINPQRQMVEFNSMLGKINDIIPEGMSQCVCNESKFINTDGSLLTLDELPVSAALVDRKTTYNMQMGVITGDGSTVWTSVSAAPLPNGNAVVVTSDLTEIKLAEEHLRSNERILRLFVEFAPAAIAMFDRNMNYIAVSQRFITDYGLVDANIIGRSHYEVFPEISQKIKDIHRRCLDGAVERADEDAFPRGDGTLDWVSWEIHPWYEKSGEIGGLLLFSEVITERKKAEISLRESEKKYRDLINNMNDAIYVVDYDMSILDVNSTATTMLGYSREELLSMNIPAIDVNMNSEQISNLAGSIQTGKMQVFETAHITKDRRIIPVEISSSLVTYGDKIVIMSIVRDIKERKLVEQKLKESENRLRSLYENATIGMYRTTPDGQILFANPAMVGMLGYSSFEELSGLSLESDLFGFKYDRKLFKTNLEKYGDLRGYEGAWTSRNGNLVYIRESAKAFTDENGVIQYYEGTVEDITLRKKAEEDSKLLAERLYLATHNAQIGIWDWDIQKNLVIWDERMYALYGLNPWEFSGVQEAWVSGLHPDDRESGELKREKALRGESEYDTEFRVLWPDGSLHWIKANGMVTRDEHGVPLRMTGMNYDITKSKMAEDELRKAKEKAEESDRLKSAFLTNMSHEIRTPMNGILGFTELLHLPDLTDDDRAEYIDIIKKSGDRMLNTINDLMEISSIEAGFVSILKSETNINTSLLFLLSFFELQARQKGLELIVQSPLPDEEAILLTDKDKLESILINLIRNAIKFTHKGSVEFGYVTKDNEIEFYVTDTGIGIPPEKIEVVFDRFIQADVTLSRRYEGSGLGLSIAKAYVEMLDGHIWVQSVEKSGSTFRFTLPWTAKKSASDRDKQVRNAVLYNLLADSTILIAEDDDVNFIYLKHFLKPLCKSMLRATCGNEAILMCRADNSIDIILMDVKMPDINGYEATRQIRTFNNEVIIISQTAFAFKGERETALQAGCDDYISKPFYVDDLLEVIMQHMK